MMKISEPEGAFILHKSTMELLQKHPGLPAGSEPLSPGKTYQALGFKMSKHYLSH